MEAGTIIRITDTLASQPKPFYTNRLYAVGGILIVSNNPEAVNGQGILYRDIVQGSWRVFLHHQNKTGSEPGGTPQPIQLHVVLENPNSTPACIMLERSGAAAHSEPQIAGYQSLVQFMQNDIIQKFTIQPGKSMAWGIDQLFYEDTFAALYDFISDIPVQLYIVTLLEDTPCEHDYTCLPVFPQHYNADGSYTIRGTFPYREICGNFIHYAGSQWRGGQFGNNPYGGYKSDPWWDWTWSQVHKGEYSPGWNAIDKETVYNWGNYGVRYLITIYLENKVSTMQTTSVLLNPRGGSYYGPVWVETNILELPHPILPIQEALVLESTTTCPGKSEKMTVAFMPPGGSSLPIRILVGNGEQASNVTFYQQNTRLLFRIK
jgi:hypothetical protein